MKQFSKTSIPESDESQLLIEHYRQLLGKPGVNYWSWKRPEALKVCPELTKLLSLPEPNFRVRAVLEAIAYGENPFQSGKGVLSELSGKEKTQWAIDFLQWLWIEQLIPAFPDEKERQQIMGVCYRLNHSTINYILDAAAGADGKHDAYSAYRNQQLSHNPKIAKQQIRKMAERDKKQSALIKNELIELYETDFVLWAERTAQLLRERSFNLVDWENLIDEVESLSRSDKRALRSQMTRVIMHLLKWQYQSEKRKKSWQDSILDGRQEIAYLIEDSPSLKPLLEKNLEGCYRSAVVKACEETDLDPDIFPVRSRNDLKPLPYI